MLCGVSDVACVHLGHMQLAVVDEDEEEDEADEGRHLIKSLVITHFR